MTHLQTVYRDLITAITERLHIPPLLLFLLLFLIAVVCIAVAIDNAPKKKVKRLIKEARETEFETFVHEKNAEDFSGIYILTNKTKRNKTYVGQSIHVRERLSQHYHGRGNPGVYYDHTYRHNRFTVKTIPLKNSGFRTLNALERNAIRVCRGYSKGYNQTRGNKG